MALQRSIALVLVLAAAGLMACDACVYLFGTKEESKYSYRYNGDDWALEYPTCGGKRQSPIMLPANTGRLSKVADADANSFSYGVLRSNGTNLKLANTGHTVQLSFPDEWKPAVKIAVRGEKAVATPTRHLSANATGPISYVMAKPAQLHFHTSSEHIVGGRQLPLEMHIVHLITKEQLPACTGPLGCPLVLGVTFELAEVGATPNPFIKTIFDAMPLKEGEDIMMPKDVALDFSQVLPKDRSYITYEGSLTTPPCTEGIAWHVMTQPMKITLAQYKQFALAVGDTYCADKAEGAAVAKEAEEKKKGADYKLPAKAKYEDGCYKLGEGHNARLPVPTYGRTIKVRNA